MIFAILAYSVTTGLTAASFDWVSFALLRFLVGIAIGSEWATGSSMMAELWPDHARGRGAGLIAMRHRHRQLPGGLCMALCRRVRPRVLAVLVSHRHAAGAADVLDSLGD